MTWFKRFPLQRKILITYVAFVLIPLTLFFALFLHKTSQDETLRHMQLLVQANETVNDRLTTIINDLKNTSAMYVVTQKVAGYVKNDFNAGTPDYIDTMRDLQANVLSGKVNPYVSSITYVTNSGARYSGAGEDPAYYEALDKIIAAMQEQGVKNMLTPVYDTVINRQSVRTITYAYSLQDTFTFRPVGYAFINIDLKKLDQSFTVFTSDSTASTMLLQDCDVVYKADTLTDVQAQDLAYTGTQRLDALKNEGPQTFSWLADGEAMLCAAQYCHALDVVLLSQIPLASVHVQTYNGVRFYLTTVLVMLVVFVAMSLFLSVRMTQPVRILQAGMQRIENGELALITEQADRQDDMGALISGFNRMVTRLRESLLREYESKDLQRKAQIKMLQSQINPHFLYNALNVIASIAEIEDVPEVSELAGNLGDMFRYNISARSKVRLEEEITQIQRYTSIQQMCTSGNVTMVYNLDSQALQCHVPKFLLQPLVENSIEHGFSDGEGGTITITAQCEGAFLLLLVCDTGRGIESSRLAALQERCADPAVLYTEEQKGDSIGLLNVNFRLKSYYGDDCGIIIESPPSGGTCVSLRIRLEEEGVRV